MRVGIIVPDGVGIRNYIYAKFFDELKARNEVVVFSAPTEVSVIRDCSSLNGAKVEVIALPNFNNTIISKLCWEASTFARLKNNVTRMNNPSMWDAWRPQKKTIPHFFFSKLVEFLGWISAQNSALLACVDQIFEESIRKTASYQDSIQILNRINPTVLLCTHQRALNAVPMFVAAKDLGIRTVSAIYSWDNLPKARLAVKADEYLAWSDYMKEELKSYYPEEADKPIHVTGSPQFEFYFDEKNFCTREAFCNEHGLDATRRIVCYSGGDTRTSPYDQQYVADLAEAIMQIPEDDRPQLLLRRCPVDLSDRYDQVLDKYDELIHVSTPKWVSETGRNWTSTYPLYEDIKLLVNTVRHCDVVCNVGSTMAHDFYTLDKPAIFLNYDPPQVEKWSTKTIYQFQHFRSMDSKDSVLWVNDKDEIGKVLIHALKNPEENLSLRREWRYKIVGPSMASASPNIQKVLTGL